ncbi:MAG: inositol monophosphatase family protein [Xanthomonadales bacterium]|nr:inositol monophosphatase family protein [Xanthomonadales bacterium]
MSESVEEMLVAAKQAAEAAAAVLMRHYGTDLDVRTKGDGSPVTEADEAAEKLIREQLAGQFPRHGFYGEEGGAEGLDREVVWLVDPLDGTKSFVRRTGFFSTQIAAMVRGELAVGVSAAPAFRETAWASSESPANLNGRPVVVREVTTLEHASISTGNIGSLARSDRWPALGRILGRAERTRGYGDFCHYHMLAAGKVDAVIESDVNILDIAALTVIVRAAGGLVTDLEGNPIGLETTSVLAASPALHALLLETLHG